MMTSLLKILVLYSALIDVAHVLDRAGQTQNLHWQLAKAARELSGRPVLLVAELIELA